MVCLDYKGFPHIFRQIVEECDFSTQLALRFAGRDARTEVDRAHCAYVIVSDKTAAGLMLSALRAAPGESMGSMPWVTTGHGFSHAPFLNYTLPGRGQEACLETRGGRTIRRPAGTRTAFSGGPGQAVGLLVFGNASPPVRLQPKGATAFALKSARVVAILDSRLDSHSNSRSHSRTAWGWDWRSDRRSDWRLDSQSRDLLLKMRPSATLAVYHTAGPGERVVVPAVRRLQVFVTPRKPYHTCRKVAEHSALFVELFLDSATAHPHCSFALSLLKPCVEHFVLRCANVSAASAFLNDVKGPLHPLLKIDVYCPCTTGKHVIAYVPKRTLSRDGTASFTLLPAHHCTLASS